MKQTEHTPLISVIVPVYNAGPHLEPCLGSILGQSYPRFEVILVDDASTDGSGALCDSLAARNSHVQAVHLDTNQGPSCARNEGIRRATGELIAFVDADDRVEPDLLKRLWEALPEGGVSVCGGVQTHAQTYQGSELIRCVLSGRPFPWTVWGKLFPAEVVRGTPFDEAVSFGEDLLFVYQVMKKVPCATCLPETLYHYNTAKADSLTNCPFAPKTSTAFAAYETVLRDVSTHVPELRPVFQQQLLELGAGLACKAAAQRRFQALKTIQRSLRRSWSWCALARCPGRVRAKAALLYVSAAAFWVADTLYTRLRGNRR